MTNETASDRLSECFKRTFRCIQKERMTGLPLLNPALRMWVSGWRDWEGCRVGVLVTPRSMSLVCVPGLGGGPGVEHVLSFPSGNYVFVEAQEADIGGFALCSLFSPVFEIADQAAAEAIAEAAQDALFNPCLAKGRINEPAQPADAPIRHSFSRRDLLRGAFLRS